MSASTAKHVSASLQSPYPPLSNPPIKDRPLHVVLACSGSVASIKVPNIVKELLSYANVRVQVIATASALHFFDKEEISMLKFLSGDEMDVESEDFFSVYDIEALADENRGAGAGIHGQGAGMRRAHVWTDIDEWEECREIGDPILHIELRRWADIVLIAPCSANTLAKLNSGICDTLLTSFLRALSSSTPTLVFPAMNTLMYQHPLTSRHIEFVKDILGYEVFGPIEKILACGDRGAGAMYEWEHIVKLVVERFGLERMQKSMLDEAGWMQ